MTDTSAVTLVKGAIHNPNEPRHFMQLVPARARHVAAVGDRIVADSTEAVVVKEVGYGIYDPVIYFPRSDVNMDLLTSIAKSTHCPLKGDTEYFDLTLGDTHIVEGAWSYVSLLDIEGLSELSQRIAFDGTNVSVTALRGEH